jgi:peptidoglycan/xylan/chitin deacetylase (PgdA/CDA1 family)
MPMSDALMRAPLAIAYWLGVGARRTGENGDDIIFLYHGTPRRVANQLERQLRYLQRLFRLVPLAAIAGSLGGCRPAGRRRQAAIIFDDGLRSNVVVAYPILRALGIPATFFVCPGLIEERMWLWTHEARRRLQFAGPHLRGELATELTAPADVQAFVQWMKDLDLPARKCVEAKVREATASFVPTGLDRDAFELADWHELRSLDPSIVTVGSHSMTHPILPRMSALEIETELRDSRCMLEAKLGRPAELFSYPNGDVDWRTNAAVRRHYRAAVSHQSGTPLDPHLLPSVHLPRGVLRLAWQVNRRAAAAAEALRHRVSATGLTTVSVASSKKSLIASPAAAASPSEDVPRESTDVLTDWLNDVPHEGADHRLDNPRDHLKHTVE